MIPRARKVSSLILKVITDKKAFFFWLFVRFVSAILPLLTIYLASLVVRHLEEGSQLPRVLGVVAAIFITRILDNYLRLRSATRIDFHISNISFDIHNFFLSDLKTNTKEERHAIVQAIRNFGDATANTLNLIKQPGIDSLVSLTFIPTILFMVDFRIFVIVIAYILIYFFIDSYTTQHYLNLKDIQNGKTEVYYGKLQDSNDFDLEQKAFTRHFFRLTNWSNTEWNILQNTAVFFYCLILLSLIYSVYSGERTLSHLVLITGYASQIQTYLNSFSNIQDSLSDMFVGLEHLAKNNAVSSIDLDDLT